MKQKNIPIVINDDLFTKIQNYYKNQTVNNSGISISLYTFLYKTARIQNNIQVFCTNTFIKDGLGFGLATIKKAKHDLIDMGLIETIQSKDKAGRFGKSYIKVNHIWGLESFKSITKYTVAKNLLLEKFGQNPIVINNPIWISANIRNKEEDFEVDYFYFEDDLLKCRLLLDEYDLEIFDYTIPTNEIEDILYQLVESFHYDFEIILTLQTQKKGKK